MKLARALLQTPRVVGVGLAASILGGLGVAGCFVDSEGLPPPAEAFYFPTGLAASPGGRVLYVANSDFDLQYNGGTVQALDLQRLRKRALALQASLAPRAAGGAVDVSAACQAVGLSTNPAPLLHPGPCAPLDLSTLDGEEEIVRGSAVIGAFASNLLLVHRPLLGDVADSDADAPQARLFVPVRGDPSVTFFDVADDRLDAPDAQRCSGDSCFRLDCGATEAGGRCGRDHRIGEDPGQELIRRKLPLEPFGIAAGPDGTSVVVSHQTENTASVIVNQWEKEAGRPKLAAVLTDLALGPTELAAVPRPRLISQLKEAKREIDYQPAFALTFIASPQLDLIRYQEASEGAAALLYQSTATPITALTSGTDNRGIAVDARERQACEAGCGDADFACLAQCTAIPLQVFVAHRFPNSLLIGEVITTLIEDDAADPDVPASRWAAAYETLAIRDSVPLAAYPSRVELGEVIGADNERHRRVFAVAFDSGYAFAYDPEARRVDAVIRTGRGPQALAFDTGSTCGDEKERCDCAPGSDGCEPYSLMYIAHFTDSYLGVVDLDMRKANTFGSMIVTVGTPVPPRESQ
ncbi:hypothetical protein [Sorangium sp. So ce1078]|uniref:hypothetical protein n=1 Tax=Sorangium sp. So ce1078 TaxID=3133329 RepID=UPI003F613ADE